MEQVGAFEAKTHLSELLNWVFKGEKFIITKHGVPIAILSPYNEKNKYVSDETIERLKKFVKNKKLARWGRKTLVEIRLKYGIVLNLGIPCSISYWYSIDIEHYLSEKIIIYTH